MFSIAGADLARFLFALTAVMVAANLFGYIAERLTVPRVIGEVLGGLLLGPTFMGFFYPNAFHWLFQGFQGEGQLFGTFYQLGLIMLMFMSGLKFQAKFQKADAKIGIWIIAASTVIPFIAGWLSTYLFDPTQFLGKDNSIIALKIVVAISIAVTSIPVISKIFFDLGIMHSRFAKVVVGIAGVHDIILWVALAVASTIATSKEPVNAAVLLKSVGITFAFLFVSLFIVPWVLKRITSKRANILFRASFLGYFLFILFAMSTIAGYLNVDIMFGSLMAGIATKLTLPEHLFKRAENSLSEISFSFFIPVYFAIVGLKLDLAKHFNPGFFVLYVLFATVVPSLVVCFTCRAIRSDPLTSANFAAAMNARGGPGIVLSTVAFSLGIINQNFFAILVMLALVTSWMAGGWLRHVIRKGKRLMPGDENLKVSKPQEEAVFNLTKNRTG